MKTVTLTDNQIDLICDTLNSLLDEDLFPEGEALVNSALFNLTGDEGWIEGMVSDPDRGSEYVFKDRYDDTSERFVYMNNLTLSAIAKGCEIARQSFGATNCTNLILYVGYSAIQDLKEVIVDDHIRIDEEEILLCRDPALWGGKAKLSNGVIPLITFIRKWKDA